MVNCPPAGSCINSNHYASLPKVLIIRPKTMSYNFNLLINMFHLVAIKIEELQMKNNIKFRLTLTTALYSFHK